MSPATPTVVGALTAPAASGSPRGRASRRGFAHASDRALAFWLLLPAALLLSLIVVYPVGRLFYTSFFDVRLSTPGAGRPFVGLDNYVFALTQDDRFRVSLVHTLLITLVTVPGALVVGLALALLANLPFRIRWPIRLALLLPWALPLVFTGLIFRWFFDSRYGVLNDVLRRLDLGPILWLTSPLLAFLAICLSIVWKTSSFMALVLLAGLQAIPRELYEAAQVDGSSRVQQFRQVTLPLLRPAIVVALVFRTITAVQTFDIPYAMTGGGPGETTETLAMYVHKTTIDFLDFGIGSALAVLMFLLGLVATAVYLRFVRGIEA